VYEKAACKMLMKLTANMEVKAPVNSAYARLEDFVMFFLKVAERS
jgi:hypothetical protein